MVYDKFGTGHDAPVRSTGKAVTPWLPVFCRDFHDETAFGIWTEGFRYETLRRL